MTAPALLVLTCSLDELRVMLREELTAARTALPSGVVAVVPLLDKRELARAPAVSAATVTRMTAEGMPHVFAGASPRYSLDEVRAWLAERGRRGTQAAPSKRETIAGVRLLSRRGQR